jgi:integrase
MRVGEIPVLRWSDIDFEKGTTHIHCQQLFIKKTREYIEVGYTKNER